MDWIKLYTSKWLFGSGRMMSPEMRGVWADLMALSGEAKLRDGTLRFDVGKPMSREYIANVLMLNRQLLDDCLDCFSNDINTDDGKPRIKIWDDGTIELTNFNKYQEVPEEKKKLTGRELELHKRKQCYKLSNEFPNEAINAPAVRKILESQDKEDVENTA